MNAWISVSSMDKAKKTHFVKYLSNPSEAAELNLVISSSAGSTLDATLEGHNEWFSV